MLKPPIGHGSVYIIYTYIPMILPSILHKIKHYIATNHSPHSFTIVPDLFVVEMFHLIPPLILWSQGSGQHPGHRASTYPLASRLGGPVQTEGILGPTASQRCGKKRVETSSEREML